MSTLIHISQDMDRLDDLLTELCGDVSDAADAAIVDEWFAELAEKLQDKADDYCALITIATNRAELRKAESKRLAELARLDQNKADFLKTRLKTVMETRGIGKLETERYRISVCGNGGPIPVTINPDLDPSDNPASPFVRTKTTYSFDIDAIRNALVAGESLGDLATLGERGTHLRIK